MLTVRAIESFFLLMKSAVKKKVIFEINKYSPHFDINDSAQNQSSTIAQRH
jgi:hypothetical protein